MSAQGDLFKPALRRSGCLRWPGCGCGCGCGTQSGPHACEASADPLIEMWDSETSLRAIAGVLGVTYERAVHDLNKALNARNAGVDFSRMPGGWRAEEKQQP